MTYDYERGTVSDYEEPEEPHIGQFIRQSRQDRLMAQSELAGRAGISRTHLGGIEHGKSEPSYRIVKALCQVLGVEPWQTWEPMQDTEAIDRLRVIQEHTQRILGILLQGPDLVLRDASGTMIQRLDVRGWSRDPSNRR